VTDALTPIADPLAEIFRRAAPVDDHEIRAAELRAEREHRARRLKFSGIGAVLAEAGRRAVLAGDERPTHALLTVRSWYARATDDRAPGTSVLILAGPMGTGKTIAAAWVLARETGIYVTVERFLRLYSARTRESEGELERLRRARFVVLDELGTERDPETFRAAFHWLIDGRQARRKLTLIMGNLSADQVRARLRDGTYDERTADRLRAIARFATTSGESLRTGAR